MIVVVSFSTLREGLMLFQTLQSSSVLHRFNMVSQVFLNAVLITLRAGTVESVPVLGSDRLGNVPFKPGIVP